MGKYLYAVLPINHPVRKFAKICSDIPA